MGNDNLYTIHVRCRPDSCLIIPVRIDADADVPDHAPWTPFRASLTPAQSDTLRRHALASPEVMEQVRDLARGRFNVADLEGDPPTGPDLPRDGRGAGGTGRVYWW